MPYEDTKILESNRYQKSVKALFVIYVDLKCLIEKLDGCKNNLEQWLTTRVSEHIPFIFQHISMSTTSSFKSIENKCDVNSDEGCMKKFGESLRKHVMTIINCFLKK